MAMPLELTHEVIVQKMIELASILPPQDEKRWMWVSPQQLRVLKIYVKGIHGPVSKRAGARGRKQAVTRALSKRFGSRA